MSLCRPCHIALLACAILATTQQARAVDTLETFDPGALDIEFYAGHEGLGQDAADRTVFSDSLVGYGLADRFSLYAGASLSADGRGDKGSLCPYAGLFGTPYDSDHLDLDLSLDMAVDGDRNFVAAPAFELNLDMDPDMQTWGIFTHGSITLCRKARTFQKSLNVASREATWAFGIGLGGYAALAPDHYLFLEGDVSLRPDPDEGERSREIGGVALGYNAQLSPAVEWISQVYIDIPQGDESVAFGMLTGLILTADL